MKVVLDANVLLAAYGFGGVCLELVELCLAQHDLVLSEHILIEFHNHLRGTFGVSESQAAAITDRLRAAALCVTPSTVSTDACPDPDDLPVLGTLAAAGADCLVTGDKALLALGSFSGHPVLSPRQFLERLKRFDTPCDQ